MLESVIDVRQLTRRFEGTLALDDVSFQVHPGEIVALLGPNGAGKTTASRIIGGILAPSEGDVLVDGISVRKDANAVRDVLSFTHDALEFAARRMHDLAGRVQPITIDRLRRETHHAYPLRGGFDAWKAAGYHLEPKTVAA